MADLSSPEAIAFRLRNLAQNMAAGSEPVARDHQAWTRVEELAEAVAALRAAPEARPLDEWHEDMGAVTWWRFPVEEASWIGTPLDSDWPGYHTHWTPHPAIPAMLAARPHGGARC